ncbi:MAG TPA: RNA methyltransferase [Actinomycetota bacterium]|nr:RNA methyltransferase [Actinomycetota bacterium]
MGGPGLVTNRVEYVGSEDPRVADYRDLTDVGWRTKVEPGAGYFLAEGEKVILRALAAGYRPRSALMAEKWLPGLAAPLAAHDVTVLVADESVLRSIVGFRLHRGALAAFERKPRPPIADLIADASRLLLLEDLVDHTNVGLIVRTAAAFGIDAVLVSPRCADPYYRRSVKTSMGAVLTMPWTVAEPWPGTLTWLREAGFTLLGLTPDPAGVDIRSWHAAEGDRLALLLGTEGGGLSAEALAAVDVWLRIPMTSRVDSLNVAAAAAVACFAVTG